MSLIPEEELNKGSNFPFAPMVDFLFLMLALFATLALSRASLFDTSLNLAKLKPDKKRPFQSSSSQMHQLHLGVDQKGGYRWITEFQSHPMQNITSVQEEMKRQYSLGLLPQNKESLEVFIHIDRLAPWENIAQLIFGVKELGFQAYPLYAPLDEEALKE